LDLSHKCQTDAESSAEWERSCLSVGAPGFAKRCERKYVLIAGNLPFADWEQNFPTGLYWIA
jgi:hypothetical protein